MHEWGDKDVDWKGIDDAAYYIADYCRRWGRLGGQYKEKYGTVRFYARFGDLSLHGLIYPGYVYYQFPKWLVRVDLAIRTPLHFCLGHLFTWIQHRVYSRAYRNALKLWPHLQAEILCNADYPELIAGHTRQDGKKLHIIDTNGKIVATWTSH